MPYHQIIMTTREKLIQEFVANVEVGAEIRISQDCATKLNAAVDYDSGWIGDCKFRELAEVGLYGAVVNIGWMECSVHEFDSITQLIVIDADDTSIIKHIKF
tara:strand:- start:833 stop:1138 length:306 start_codon:yes stop_codon:yes gene_type:complete